MAERAIPTALLFESVSKLLKGDAPASLTHLSLCGEDMSGFDVDTTDFADELTREAIAPSLETITKTDDTVVQTKADWEPYQEASANDTIYGAGMFCGLADATLQAFHEWAASVLFTEGDTVTETMKIQSKLGT